MHYQVTLETSAGTISATWGGREYVHIFEGADESARDVINIWNYHESKPHIAENAEALARCVRDWFNENEPDILIERILCSTTTELEQR